MAVFFRKVATADEIVKRFVPSLCEPCDGRGYFDSRHLGYQGHTTCSWCNGTGRAAMSTGERQK